MKALQSNEIQSRIHTIRGLQIMLDSDLADLYDVETKQLNRAVKRNKSRFPAGFCFQLNTTEYEYLRCQFGTFENRKYLPYAFTEQGVAMLSGILRSETAIRISIQIMQAFVSMRKFIASNALLFQRLDKTEIKLLEHDKKFDEVFDAIQSRNIRPEKGIFF